MTTKVVAKGITRLFYVLDIEALFISKRDYLTLWRGTEEEARRMEAEEDGRYEVYTSRRDFNAAMSYYRTIL